MSKGFDCDSSVISIIPAIKAAGFEWVGRYLPCRTKHSPLSHTEAAALSQNGLYVVSIWESGRMDELSYYTAEQGYADGLFAWASARAVGQPFGTPIYFAFDLDASVTNGIQNYLLNVRHAFLREQMQNGPEGYYVGVYGSGLVCREFFMKGYTSFTWLAQAMGWAQSAQYKASGDWHILQGETTDFLGLSVDLNEASSKGGGGWRHAEATT